MKRLIFIVIAAVTALGVFTSCATGGSELSTSDSEGFSTEIEVAAAEQIADSSTSVEDNLDVDADEQEAQSAAGQSQDAQNKESSADAGTAKGASSQTKNSSSSGSASSKSGSSSQNASSKTDSSSSKANSSSAQSSTNPSSSSPASSSNSSSSKQNSVGTIGTFTMTDLSGNTATQSILNKYDLTMINVWATYCNPCITEIPEIDEVYKEFKGKSVNIIGVALDGPGNVSSIQSIVNKTGASYKMYIPSSSMLSNSFMSNVTFVPTTFFVDRNGNLVGSAVSGSRTASAWRKILNERLAQAN